MLGDAAAMLEPRVDSEIANHLSYMDAALGMKDFFVGNELTGADIMLIFVCEAAGARLEPYKNLVRYRDAIHARTAYKTALDKGGPYQLMSR
jgi:glutathione S-transferase